MKKCPVCNIKYADDAEFCAKCKAHLAVIAEDESVPFDKKRLITAILCTIGFMAFIAGMYYVYTLFM